MEMEMEMEIAMENKRWKRENKSGQQIWFY